MTNEQRNNVQRYLKFKQNGRVRRRIEGEKINCEKCGASSGLEWHHLILFSEGGTDDPENLAVLCNTCHQQLHKTNNDFKKAGRWGGLVSAYLRENCVGKERSCKEMKHGL